MIAAYRFYEFFAGGGMARAGLGARWSCALANDYDRKKAAAYAANWGDADLICGDVADLDLQDAPGHADLAWASFPCQDLSLAGAGAGLSGTRSGVFWPFWDLMLALRNAGRAPKIVALENVCGLLTSDGGRDFQKLIAALVRGGYRPGAMVIDAARFTPQSRPRLFVVAVDEALGGWEPWSSPEPNEATAPATVQRAVEGLGPALAQAHVWWRLDLPLRRRRSLRAVATRAVRNPAETTLWTAGAETEKWLSLMSKPQLAKVLRAQMRASKSGRSVVGSLYKRGRPGPDGVVRQRAEVRFDGLAGCLRTPAGGSSRQSLIEITPCGDVRTRLIGPREAARLMGLPERYKLPKVRTDAYHLLGDGVAVPVVRWLARGLIEPVLDASATVRGRRDAA